MSIFERAAEDLHKRNQALEAALAEANHWRKRWCDDYHASEAARQEDFLKRKALEKKLRFAEGHMRLEMCRAMEAEKRVRELKAKNTRMLIVARARRVRRRTAHRIRAYLINMRNLPASRSPKP